MMLLRCNMVYHMLKERISLAHQAIFADMSSPPPYLLFKSLFHKDHAAGLRLSSEMRARAFMNMRKSLRFR